MRIGIDLGGTKIEGIALDDAGGELVRRRIPTPRDDYDATVAAVAGLVHELERRTGATGTVGVGTPGAISPATGLIKNANSVWLNDMPLDKSLEEALGRPVRMANDANCFALSEATDGAAVGVSVVFGVILGTGVGGGVVIDGRPLTGANALAGEWGHNPLPAPKDDERPGPPCYCGRHGCIETFLSGRGLERDLREATGRRLPAQEIDLLARRGDDDAEAALRRYEERLARALGSIINVLDPDAIVLGGGVSNIDRLYASVPAIWGPYVFSDRVDTKLLKNKHGDSSGVRGAAWLWPARGKDQD
jgi:fructokinase